MRAKRLKVQYLYGNCGSICDGKSEEKCRGAALEPQVPWLFPDGAWECWVRVAPQAVERFKDAMRQKFRAGRGRNVRAFPASPKPKLRGWASYFSVAETRAVFEDI